jgi:hypothetical protein
MHDIRPKIITDQDQQPIAVQIDYAEWLRIAALLNLGPNGKPPTDLSRHAGTLAWPVDGLDYQQRVRSEWA